jgi:3-deoxy-alpha-D-manno-octulosonate 8-oxidase
MAEKQKVEIPSGICKNLTDQQFKNLIDSTIIHERPLSNALGSNFRKVLSDEKIIDLFSKM